MQYTTEGVRPVGSIQRNAHCPVPVVMLFDAMEVLGRETTKFSDGNLASPKSKIGDDADFFAKIAFDLVYHDDVMPEATKREITICRQAEIIVPGELDLDGLRFVVCRSLAEQETLLHLLDKKTRDRWSKNVLMKTNLHKRLWNFVNQVDLVNCNN